VTHSTHSLGVADALGIDTRDLGCVMLPVSGLDLFELLPQLTPEDLYTSPDPAKFWVKGDVVRDGGHVTLLYGLLEKPWRMLEVVQKALDGWEFPDVVRGYDVDVFPSPYPDEPYDCVVAKVDVSHELLDAHARLSYLPHVNTYPEYTPHVTLAYVQAGQGQRWADILAVGAVGDGGILFDVVGELDLGKRDTE